MRQRLRQEQGQEVVLDVEKRDTVYPQRVRNTGSLDSCSCTVECDIQLNVTRVSNGYSSVLLNTGRLQVDCVHSALCKEKLNRMTNNVVRPGSVEGSMAVVVSEREQMISADDS